MKSLLVSFILCILATLSIQARSVSDSYSYVRRDGGKAIISIEEISDSLSIMRYTVNDSVCSEWKLPYPTYRFCCHDLNNDGIPEIAVGVIKSTRYSKVVAKRLFIFKLFEEDVIRPLWLGSRVSHKLEDFTLEDFEGKGVVHTYETTDSGESIQMLYYLKGFGLKFLRQINVSSHENSPI